MNEAAEDIAHELRQPLAAILSNAQAACQLLLASRPDLAQFREILEDIIESERRAVGILQRLEDLLRAMRPTTVHPEQGDEA